MEGPVLNSKPAAAPRGELWHLPGAKLLGSEAAYRALSYAWGIAGGVVALLFVAIVTHLFIATVFRISGESMLPNFQDGQFVLVDRVGYVFSPPRRGDVVVLEFPGDPTNRKFIKRIIGLPGEKVEIRGGQVLVNDQPLLEAYLPRELITTPAVSKALRADEYFVMGDNRPNSNDSRFFGPLPAKRIIGKTTATLTGRFFEFVAQPAF